MCWGLKPFADVAWEFLKVMHCYVNRKSCKVTVEINQEISVPHATGNKTHQQPLFDLFVSVGQSTKYRFDLLVNLIVSVTERRVLSVSTTLQVI